MKILITGATGYIGAELVKHLLAAGHSVTGFARHPEKARALMANGMRFSSGSMTETGLLEDLAAEHEGIVHAAAADGPDRGEVDRKAVEALVAGAKGGKASALIYTSGIWVLGNTGDKPADERSALKPASLVAWRPASEQVALQAASRALRAQVVRPGIVYGGKGGIMGQWWADAVREKKIRAVGDGSAHWPLVHVADLAALYGLLLEKGKGGAVYHATDDSTYAVRDLAGAVAKATSATIDFWPFPEAKKKLGAYAEALVLDQRVKSPASRKLGWAPVHTDFVKEASSLLKEFR